MGNGGGARGAGSANGLRHHHRSPRERIIAQLAFTGQVGSDATRLRPCLGIAGIRGARRSFEGATRLLTLRRPETGRQTLRIPGTFVISDKRGVSNGARFYGLWRIGLPSMGLLNWCCSLSLQLSSNKS
jgi:hypothetical protein